MINPCINCVGKVVTMGLCHDRCKRHKEYKEYCKHCAIEHQKDKAIEWSYKRQKFIK